MKKLILIASLFLSFNLYSQINFIESCDVKVQGGPDAFPWGQAQPFPWTKIQGLWTVQGDSDLVLKITVIRQTSKFRQLDVEFYSRSADCFEPAMRGVGLITALEKNVVRINSNNKLIKLAIFKPADLELNTNSCKAPVMAMSVVDLDFTFSAPYEPIEETYTASNVLLKKITTSLNLYCKKR
jgi:hypothetical protein